MGKLATVVVLTMKPPSSISGGSSLVDLDSINELAYYGAPKYMEWYSVFGVLVTLVWLYLEILDLIQKLKEN
ncbi:hypothetical protein CLQ_13853 (plasmid) [Clostridium botulinum Af84]|uniref:Bax inhibitor-1/YccA family membrane protein n=1 Tax=Clostridium botulinum TaxID=1491 RepID=UPI00035BACC2|nr:Bax inhibitor-1/YccA family protein [Clostridium botulinum]APR02638.1 bax inhibitor 1 like family protein [Clostridium botulinum]AUN19698.1 hypothetical protein B2M06_19255 [Clostridium botulinum]EPS54376.1 hypothetical protein CLQ_13853 [Clostridium botulinum Af84]